MIITLLYLLLKGGFNPFMQNFPRNNFGFLPQNNFSNFTPPPIPMPPVNFEEKFKEQLQKLEEMGFTNKTANIEALKATNGNVEAAIERMMNLGVGL